MKIIFVGQESSHPVHETWSKAITKKHITYIPGWICKSKVLSGFTYKHPIINQFLAAIKGIFTPRAEMYIVEGFKAILPAIIKRKKNTKIVLINSDTFFINYPKQNWLIKKLYKWYIKNVDYYICTSSIMEEMAKKESNVPCYILHPFIDTEKFEKVSGNLKSSNICSIATARYSKGADIMLNAFDIFLKEFPKSTLFICDWGDYLSKLKKHNKVDAPGFCDPIERLKKSGLYINASRLEPFGVGIIEAMAAGIPPVISEFCGAKDIVEKVDKSLICKLDAKKIAEAMIDLQKNLEKKIQLSEKCKKIAKENNEKNSIKKLKEIIKEIEKDINSQ